MKLNRFFFSVLSVSFFLLSCSKTENRFIDIQKVNSEILEHTGIDILAFQDQIEKDFSVDDSFYDSILIQTSTENTNDIFKKYGYYSVRANGDTLRAVIGIPSYYALHKDLPTGLFKKTVHQSTRYASQK